LNTHDSSLTEDLYLLVGRRLDVLTLRCRRHARFRAGAVSSLDQALQSVEPPALLALNTRGSSCSSRAGLGSLAVLPARSVDKTTDQADQQSSCVNGATSGVYAYYGPEVKHAVDRYRYHAPVEMPPA
jgi:hypothetical protein